jgi:tRNA A-37 threonylcarbamoyl transferase component Bud32
MFVVVECTCWVTQSSHCQVIERILKHEGAVLKHVIRELAKAIAELSGRGFVHGRLRVENICLKIQELKTAIKI